MTDIQSIAVVGAGTMGHGIAQVAAQAGCQVRLADALPGAAERGLARIRANLEGALARGKLTAEQQEAILARLAVAADARRAAEGADAVIEAVPERLDLKQALFRELDEVVSPEAVLATNTSSLSLAAIAGASRRPARVIGMHFFNPVHVMKLVEVVVHDAVDAGVQERVLALAQAMGKDPIVVKDSPGFASSRLGIALGLEAMRMLERGVASAADIDKAMTLGYNHPMGPLRLTDVVGLDVRLAIAEYLHGTLGTATFEPPAILRRLVGEGKLGQKTGQGFYAWVDG